MTNSGFAQSEAGFPVLSTHGLPRAPAQELAVVDSISRGAGRERRGLSSILTPLQEAVDRLETMRAGANARNVDLCIFACTEARSAVAVTADSDRRDLKFLSGSKTREGWHSYCGGMQGAISRALIYACHADVVCYRTWSVDLGEAKEFASEITEAFPGKRLGFGHAPRPNGAGWNELQHRGLEVKLRALGYEFYFVTQFGCTVFPYNLVPDPSALIHDSVWASDLDFAGLSDQSRFGEGDGPGYPAASSRAFRRRVHRHERGASR
jgi:hypothetical protein